MNPLTTSPKKFEALLKTPQANNRLLQVNNHEIKIDDYGLVIPDVRSSKTLEKISSGLVETRDIITEVRNEGKHVIYLPGSFDLVHVGHASYLLQALENLFEHKRINHRDDAFVVMLADDDNLIEAVKPAHLYAINGEHPRPLENESLYSAFRLKANPRLLDLATLPVDLVGLIPAPSNIGQEFDERVFRRWINNRASFNQDSRYLLALEPNEAKMLTENLTQYEQLLHKIRTNNMHEVLASFQATKFGLKDDKSNWDIQSWQMLIHKYITSTPVGAGSFTRIISNSDTKYKNIVARTMNAVGIDHLFIDDDAVLSTTDLVRAFSWKELYAAKSEAYRK